jgi:hypothetical protein
MHTSRTIVPETFEEKVIWYAITGTWLCYGFGALYVLAPAIGWLLVFRVFYKAYITDSGTLPSSRIHVPAGAWVWIAGMLVMLLALLVGHAVNALGMAQTLKSVLGWVKGWALMAIFPLIGATLRIRPQVLYRAGNRLALQTIWLLPLFLVAPVLHLPAHLYVSPLQMLGGPGPEFFEVQLYGREFEGGLRWRFWTPWAPAAGFVANIYLILGMQDRDLRWKICGFSSAVAICLLSQSRLALIAMVVTPAISFALSRIGRPATALSAAVAATLVGVTFQPLLDFAGILKARFAEARAASSRVRATLGRIAYQRWKDEAPMFGHGIVVRGPHLVEYMPIGSHHTWFGLLYVKGLVGFSALLVPMLWTTVELIAKAQSSRRARAALCITITIWLYTFGENLEVLVYLFWPGLIALGLAFRQRRFGGVRIDLPLL